METDMSELTTIERDEVRAANGFREAGIHIGLDEDEYLADNAIGGSGIKSMIFEPEEWWWNSIFNNFKTQVEDKRTDGKDFGSALHKMLLEGVEEYESCFALGFDETAHKGSIDSTADLVRIIEEYNSDNYDPTAIRTVSQMQSLLVDLGLPKSGSKAELKSRLIDAAPNTNFSDFTPLPKTGSREELTERVLTIMPNVDLMDTHRSAHEKTVGDRKIISPEWDKAIRMMRQIAIVDPIINELFSEGVPEVSVFWRDPTGAPCRARFDWLRIDKTCDLKSYAGRMGRHRSDNLVNAVMNYRYDLQEAHYRKGRKAMKGLPVHGGTDAQRDYLERCIEADNAGFSFVFAKTQGAPFIEEVRMDDFIIGSADTERTRALESWGKYFDIFGLSEPWLTPSTTRDLNATDFPAYFGLAAVA